MIRILIPFLKHRFCEPNSNLFIMLLSTKAGGVGINLTTADTVVIFDSDWNPQNDIQYIARTHCLGQTTAVKFYRLLTRKTYEMHLLDKVSLKLGLDYAVMQNMRAQSSNSDDNFKVESLKKNRGKKRKLSVEEINIPVDGHLADGGEETAGRSRDTMNQENTSKHENTLKKPANINVKWSLNSTEMQKLLKQGANDIIAEEKVGVSEEETRKFCEADIDQILQQSTVIVHDKKAASDAATSPLSFSRPYFMTRCGDVIDIDDLGSWANILPPLEVDYSNVISVLDNAGSTETNVHTFPSDDTYNSNDDVRYETVDDGNAISSFTEGRIDSITMRDNGMVSVIECREQEEEKREEIPDICISTSTIQSFNNTAAVAELCTTHKPLAENQQIVESTSSNNINSDQRQGSTQNQNVVASGEETTGNTEEWPYEHDKILFQALLRRGYGEWNAIKKDSNMNCSQIEVAKYCRKLIILSIVLSYVKPSQGRYDAVDLNDHDIHQIIRCITNSFFFRLVFISHHIYQIIEGRYPSMRRIPSSKVNILENSIDNENITLNSDGSTNDKSETIVNSDNLSHADVIMTIVQTYLKACKHTEGLEVERYLLKHGTRVHPKFASLESIVPIESEGSTYDPFIDIIKNKNNLLNHEVFQSYYNTVGKNVILEEIMSIIKENDITAIVKGVHREKNRALYINYFTNAVLQLYEASFLMKIISYVSYKHHIYRNHNIDPTICTIGSNKNTQSTSIGCEGVTVKKSCQSQSQSQAQSIKGRPVEPSVIVDLTNDDTNLPRSCSDESDIVIGGEAPKLPPCKLISNYLKYIAVKLKNPTPWWNPDYDVLLMELVANVNINISIKYVDFVFYVK